MRLRPLAAALRATTLVVVTAATTGSTGHAARDPGASGQHSAPGGHLRQLRQGVELVGKAAVPNRAPMAVGDLTVHEGYAYLAGFAGRKCTGGKVHVFDIRNLRSPRVVGSIPTGKSNYVGEGQQVIMLSTASFAGDVLLFQNEVCGRPGRTTVGGATLVDVTNPRAPKVLAAGFGDRKPAGSIPGRAHMAHSAFAWTAAERAYAVLVDNEERAAVDIFDISNPRRPVQVAEYNVPARFPRVLQPGRGLDQIFFHDAVVREIDGLQVMLLSYWDAGFITLDVTDPRRPAYLGDSDFAAVDAEVRRRTGASVLPEGNAHEAEFTKDGKYIVGADEDFETKQVTATTDDSGEVLVAEDAGAGRRRLPAGRRVSGRAVYVGRACRQDVPRARQAGGPYLGVVELGGCGASDKARRVEQAGYEGTVFFGGSGRAACRVPSVRVYLGGKPAIALARRSAYALFDRGERYDEKRCRVGAGGEPMAIRRGARGDRVRFRSTFDGWGYLHLYGNTLGKLPELDTYAIREAMDVRYARGFGLLSVHEAATSHRRAELVYSAYFSGGVRVLRIENDRLQEVGAFIDRDGNRFWGVEVFERGGREYVAASDMDFGLYLLRYTGDR